jgi:serine/threonine protein kinase/TolB-like protein
MTSQRADEWRRVRDVFERALDLPVAERKRFLTDACLEDVALQQQVAKLLDAHERADDFLETGCVAQVPDWPDEDLAGAQFGPYRLEHRIGGGGMGEVYRARDTRLGRTVAIKVLLSHTAVDEPSRERFEREARVVAGLSHPHICTLHDIGTYRESARHGLVPYLVMEFLNGETLAERLSRGPLPVGDALDCAMQIASALDAAHRAAIVHRDLKPRNVMMTTSGAKLLDFGLAKAAPEPVDTAAAPISELTTPGMIVGTLQYMAPEQLEGLPTDARTDVFAFGCLLYEMFSGRKAFDGRTNASVMTAILAREPTPLRELVPSLPESVEALVRRCLSKPPTNRWQSAAELLIELKRVAEGLRSGHDAGRIGRFVLNRWRTAAIVTALVAVVAGAATFRPRSSPPTALVPTTSIQIAVLPLRMVGGTTGGDEYLGVGIADSIITRLAGLRQVGLRPTAAVLGYADAPADPATVAKALAVDRVLVGTIQRSADTYRITLQLVQSADGTVSWARSYDVLRSALTNLQDTIAEEVVTALRLELTPAERDRVRRRYTDNAQAYDLYLRGRASFVNYTERGMKTAIGDFEHALSIDPDYALARAGLAIACAWFSIRYAYETEASEWGARAEREAKAALADDPSLAEATLAMASAAGTLYGDFNWPVVIADATRALAMDPTLELAHIVRMRAFFHLGLFERMAQEAGDAHRLNPLGNVEIARLEVAGSLFSGSYGRAREQATVLLARSDAPVIRNYLGLAQFYTGDVAGARATLAAVQRAGRPDVRSQAALAGVEAAAGDTAAARVRALGIERGPYMDHHVAYSLGAAWAQLGDVSAAVRWLQQAADSGFPSYPSLMQDRLLDPIRRAPEFTALLDRLRSRYEQDAARYPPRTSPLVP